MSGDKTENKNLSVNNPTNINDEAKPEVLKENFIVIKEEIFDYATRLDELHKLVGKGSKEDLYNLVKTSKDSAKNLSRAIGQIEISKNFTPETKKEIKETINDISIAAFLRGDAYDFFMKYIDKESLEDGNKMRESFESAERRFINGNNKLIKIEKELNI